MRSFLSRSLVTLLAAGVFGWSARAQDSWTGAADNTWTNANNWFLFTVPAPGADVSFDANSTANLTTDLGANFALNKLAVADPAGAVAVTNFALTLGAGGLDLSAALQNLSVGSRLELGADQTWTVAATAALTVSGVQTNNGFSLSVVNDGAATFSGNLGGTGGLRKSGAGMLTLNGAVHNFSGGTVVSGGTVRLSNYNGGSAPAATDFTVVTGLLEFVSGYFNANPLGGSTLRIVVTNGGRMRIGAAHALGGSNLNGGSIDVLRIDGGTITFDAEQYLAEGLSGGLGRLILRDAVVNGSGGNPRGADGGSVISVLASTITNVWSKGMDINYAAATFVVDDGLPTDDLSFLGNLNGSNPFIKSGAGRMALEGTCGLTGSTLINGGTLALGVGGLLSNTLSFQITTGAVLDVSAKAAFVLSSNQTLQGFGAVTGVVLTADGARVMPGGAGTAGTLDVGGVLALGTGATNLFDLGATTNEGAGVSDLVRVTGDLDVSNAVLAITFTAAPANGTYRLFTYTGSLLGGFNTNLLVVTSRSVALDTSTVGQVNLVVTGSGADLAWNSATNGAWNSGVNAHWLDLATTNPALFTAGDAVRFDDTLGVTTTISLTGTLLPASVLVTSAVNQFTLAGAGKLSGAMGLTKAGTSTLVVANTGGNDYQGALTINAGVLRAGTASALGATNAGTTVAAGAALDVNGQALSSERVTISGHGPGGAGAVVNGGADQLNALTQLALAAPASLNAGAGRWDLRLAGAVPALLDMGGFALAKRGTNIIGLADGRLVNPGDLLVESGTLYWNRFTNDVAVGNHQINAGGVSRFRGYTTNGPFFLQPISLNGGTLLSGNGDANNYLGATVTLLAPSTLDADSGDDLHLTNVISGPAGFTKAGTGALLLYASNTYAGVTVVSNGPSSQTSAALWLRNYAALGTNQVQLRNPAVMTALYFPADIGSGTLVNPIGLNNATNNTTRITTDEANTFIATLSGVISGGHVTSELLFDNDNGTADAGRTRLGNPANTFVASRVRVNRGGLAIGSDGALGDAQNDVFLDVTESGVGSGLNVESDGVTLGAGRGVTINSLSVIHTDTNRVTLAGPLFGGGELVKRGEGTLTVAGLNSHSGALNITNGTVRIGDGGLTGSFGSGAIRNNGQLVVDTAAALTFGNTLSGTGGLVKTGSGLLGLTGARTYSGATVISNGTLAVYGTHSGGQYYLVHPPGVLAGNGTVNSEALVAGIVRPGPTNALTVTNLTAGFLARLQVFGGGTGAILRVTGTNGLTVPAGSDVLRVDVLGLPPAVGTFTVLNYEGAVQGGAATNVVLGDFPPRAAMTLAENAGNSSIDLTVTDLGERIKWTGATDALWDRDDTTNWVTEAGGVPTAYLQDILVGDRVRFDDTAVGNFSVSVADPVNPAELVVSNELNDYTISGDAIGGSVGLVKQGAAALTLSTSNDFEGATQVQAGRLAIARADALGRAPGLVVSNQLRLAAGATLAFNGAVEVEPTRGLALGSPLTASPVVLDAGPFGSTVRGPLGNEAGSTGVLRKIGAGPVALTAAGTFSGDTIISAGALVLANGGALGGAGTLRLGDFTSGTNAVGIYVDANVTHVSQNFARPITVSVDGTGPVTIGSMVETGFPTLVTATFSGAITLSNRSITLRSGAGDSTFFSGAIQGTGDVTVVNGGLYPDVGRGWGGNRVVWSTAAKTFVGNLTIQGGAADSPTILQINLADSIPNSATVTVENAAVLRLNVNETLGVLAGPGRVRGVVATRSLTLGVNNESYTFGGVLENDPTLDAGSLNLAKVGTGTLTLTGTNTYTSGTAISGGGVLSVDVIADAGESRMGYPGAAGAGYIGIREATLRYTGSGSNSTTRYLWIDQTSTNNVIEVTQAAAQLHLYPSGGTRNQPWVKQGAGTLTIGTGAWSGPTVVSNGTLRLSDVSGFTAALRVDSTLAITSTIPFATKWNYGGSLQGTGLVIKSGSGVFQFTRTNALAGTLLITQGLVGNDATNADWTGCTADVNIFPGAVLDLRADSVRMDALDGAGLITNSFGPGGIEATNLLVVGVSGGNGLFIGNIYGSGAGAGGENQGRIALHKVGAGQQVLGGTCVYAGPTWVSNGTLAVSGSIASSVVSVVSGATLSGGGSIEQWVRGEGTVNPTAILTVGSYTQAASGTLRFDIGGVLPGLEHGRLSAAGAVSLDGALLGLLDGFTPSAGQVFTVVTASAISGTFATTNLPALDPGLGWEVVYAGSAVSLVVTGGVPALTPYEQWAQSIPNPAERGEQADPDGDGYANLLEYSQGTDATNSADNAKLALVRTNGQFLVLFNRVNSATDIVYEVEGAYLPTNNALWLGIATNVIGSWGSSTNVNDNNTAAVHRVLVTDLEIGTNRSLRLKVTRP